MELRGSSHVPAPSHAGGDTGRTSEHRPLRSCRGELKPCVGLGLDAYDVSG